MTGIRGSYANHLQLGVLLTDCVLPLYSYPMLEPRIFALNGLLSFLLLGVVHDFIIG